MSVEPLQDEAAKRDDEPMTPRGKWPPFPWNPSDLDNPMIGRDDALEDLGRAFDEVLAHWLVRIHLLVSDYGLGKSRLLSAFVQAAREREPATFAIEVRCPNAGAGGGPYRLWDAVVRAAFQVPADVDATLAAASGDNQRSTARFTVAAASVASTSAGTWNAARTTASHRR